MQHRLHHIPNWRQGIFFLMLLLTSCVNKNNNSEKKLQIGTPPENSLIRAVDSAEFRTLYEELTHESLQNRKADFDYNPLLMSELNLNLSRRLHNEGLMKEDRLILGRFKPNEHFNLKDSAGNSLSINMNYFMESSTYRIAIANKKDTTNIEFTEYLPVVKVAVADIIPGGFKELIVLRNFYIMNGDNYYINIYEVKCKDYL